MPTPTQRPKPRLCHLKKVPDFAGYGFNLQAQPGMTGQFVGKVDPGSPAESAGLLKGDRVVEVNGCNVEQFSHHDVVSKIKERTAEVFMLVADRETDDYYKTRDLPITESLLADAEAAKRRDSDTDSSDSDSNSDDKSSKVAKNHVSANVSVVENAEKPQSVTNNLTFKPRLCVLKKSSTFAGYGFNLQKQSRGQCIGKVDPDSPAEKAGLREGDRLVEVNGENVESDSHGETVSRIKANPSEVSMLVVDEAADQYFRDNGIRITAALLGDERPRQAEHKELQKSESAGTKSTSSSHTVTNSIAGKIAVAAVVQEARSSAPKPRWCELVRGPTFNGYGFNLHTAKGCSGQYIGKVDPGSPAETAGLRENDKVIEVNGVNVENDNHGQVVNRIKEKPNAVTMLVADLLTEAYYRDRNIPITRDLLNDNTISNYDNGVRNGSPKHQAPVTAARNEPTSIASVQPSSDVLALTPAQVRERLQQNNPRVRVKQTDKSFKDKSAAFNML